LGPSGGIRLRPATEQANPPTLNLQNADAEQGAGFRLLSLGACMGINWRSLRTKVKQARLRRKVVRDTSAQPIVVLRAQILKCGETMEDKEQRIGGSQEKMSTDQNRQH
jgi:hypothetical protein